MKSSSCFGQLQQRSLSSNSCKDFIAILNSYSKEKEQTAVYEKVREYEASKQGYFNSMKGWLGYGKSEQEHAEER